MPARPSPKGPLNLKPGTFAPRVFELDSNPARTAVNRVFLGSRRYQRRFTLWAAATRGGVELESNCSRPAVTLRFFGRSRAAHQANKVVGARTTIRPLRRCESPKQASKTSIRALPTFGQGGFKPPKWSVLARPSAHFGDTSSPKQRHDRRCGYSPRSPKQTNEVLA